MRVNAVSINLKKDEIVIKLKEDAKQEEIVAQLKKNYTKMKKHQ